MDTNTEIKGENEKSNTRSFFDIARRIMLAGIGAIAISHDELEEFIDKLVERGEIAKKDGESLLGEMKERRKKYMHGDETYFQRRMDELFSHFNIPAKRDFDDLNAKITDLEKKIDELTKTKK